MCHVLWYPFQTWVMFGWSCIGIMPHFLFVCVFICFVFDLYDSVWKLWSSNSKYTLCCVLMWVGSHLWEQLKNACKGSKHHKICQHWKSRFVFSQGIIGSKYYFSASQVFGWKQSFLLYSTMTVSHKIWHLQSIVKFRSCTQFLVFEV